MKYIATFRRINPQLSSGGYETTVDIEAKNLKQAEREANKISDRCIYGAMVLLNIVPDLPILKTCSDYKRIRDALTVSALRKIERILTAFSKRRIDFAEPTDESGNYIMNETELRITQRLEGEYVINADQINYVIDTFASPSSKHVLGTDGDGFDMLARIMYGGRVSLMVGSSLSLSRPSSASSWAVWPVISAAGSII